MKSYAYHPDTHEVIELIQGYDSTTSHRVNESTSEESALELVRALNRGDVKTPYLYDIKELQGEPCKWYIWGPAYFPEGCLR